MGPKYLECATLIIKWKESNSALIVWYASTIKIIGKIISIGQGNELNWFILLRVKRVIRKLFGGGRWSGDREEKWVTDWDNRRCQRSTSWRVRELETWEWERLRVKAWSNRSECLVFFFFFFFFWLIYSQPIAVVLNCRYR